MVPNFAKQCLIVIFGTITGIERERREKRNLFLLARYRPYSIISFHRGRSRSAERLGCVPPRWKFRSSKRKTVDLWGYIASKARETVRNRLSNVKRADGASVYAFRSETFFSNGVEKRFACFIWEVISWEGFYIKIRRTVVGKGGSIGKIEFYDGDMKLCW